MFNEKWNFFLYDMYFGRGGKNLMARRENASAADKVG